MIFYKAAPRRDRHEERWSPKRQLFEEARKRAIATGKTVVAIQPIGPFTQPYRNMRKALLKDLTVPKHSRDDSRQRDLNSGKVFHLRRGTNTFTGKPGWQPMEIPDFDPIAPHMVIHDIIEHVPGAPATPEEEFKAQGCTLFLRHEGGFFHDRGERASDVMQNAFGTLYYFALPAGRKTAPCPLEPMAQEPLENADTEMELVRAVAKAREFCQGHSVLSKKMKEIDKSLCHAIGWMRVGYRVAQHRFHGINVKRFARVYRKASDLIAKYLDAAEDGDEMTIVVQPEEYKVRVSLNPKAVTSP